MNTVSDNSETMAELVQNVRTAFGKGSPDVVRLVAEDDIAMEIVVNWNGTAERRLGWIEFDTFGDWSIVDPDGRAIGGFHNTTIADEIEALMEHARNTGAWGSIR